MLTILTCGAAYALPVGNPSEASLLCDGLVWEGHCGSDPCDPCLTWCDAFSLRVGFYGDYVFNRHMRTRHGPRPRAQIENFEIWTNAAYLAANFWDRFDIFATLGTTSIDLSTNISAFAPIPVFVVGERIDIVTDSRFSWSVGGRGTIWECGCTALGIEGQYFRTRPNITRISVADVFSFYPNDFETTYSEWQVGLGLSHRINMFVPYVAVKWSGSKWDSNSDFETITFGGGTVTTTDFKNKKHWGYAVGVSLIDCEKAMLTVEGRFADEKAVYVNGQIRF